MQVSFAKFLMLGWQNMRMRWRLSANIAPAAVISSNVFFVFSNEKCNFAALFALIMTNIAKVLPNLDTITNYDNY